MISYQNHSPYFGCFQDSLIGACQITQNIIEFDKYHAMCLFSNINLELIDKQFNFNKNKYSGRELVSMFLPRVNFPRKKASIYRPQYEKFIKYTKEDTYVQVNRGELISGCLDSSTVGQGKMGSLFHIINNEYGARVALETIYNFQQISSRFFLWSGFTVGIKDINLSDNTNEKIKKKTQAIINEANFITEKLNNKELIPPIGMSVKDYYEMEMLNALEPGDDFVEPILSDFDFETNKILKLVFSGAKGKIPQLIAINGAQGQITLNGKRPLRNFAWGRTSPYFPRYDTSPESSGFIKNSYREGISSDVFPWALSESRNGSIANALSTSISGAQSRLNIKNTESAIVDNFRKCVKGENIIQPLYAESGIDPRKTEKVKFLNMMISDKEMEEKYKSHPKDFNSAFHNKDVEVILNEEYKQLMEDRHVYREIMFKLESDNPGQFLMNGEHQMPVNPFRIIENVIYNYSSMKKNMKKEEQILDPVKSINLVRDLCSKLGYAHFNSIQEAKGMKIPSYIETSMTLLKILIRLYLSTSNLKRKDISNFQLNIIIDKIRFAFRNSLIDYGSAVGIIAAQCLSEPLTQYVLDSKHKVGVGGNKTNAIVRIKEILGAKTSEKMKNVSMLIIVKEEFEKNKLKVQEIASHIEMMKFGRFVISKMLFFEEYGKPVHSKFKHEAKMIRDFEKFNRGIEMVPNLSKWCIRYELDKEKMVLNNMKLNIIITKLRLSYPKIFFVYTPENADKIIIRCYISHNMIKVPVSMMIEDYLINMIHNIEDTLIRGIENIRNTEIVNIVRSELQNDGSIKTIKTYGIGTIGSNLEEVLDNPYVDPYRTQTDSIHEIKNMFGIDAARNKIINEIRKTMPSIIIEHAAFFGDEQTYSGDVTGIQKTGLQAREMNNVTLRLSFQSPIQVIENAAINNLTDKLTGISSHLVVGSTPSIGTTWNDVCINESFIEEQMQNLSVNIDDEL